MHRLLYQNHMGTVNLKTTIYIHTQKCNTKDGHQSIGEWERKRRENYMSIISLHVNGLKAVYKKHRMAEWILKKTYILSIRTHFRYSHTYRLKMRGVERGSLCKLKQKKALHND